MSEPARNRAGRAIWFVSDAMGDGGLYRPVTREGRRAFLFAASWVLGCGVGGMAGFAMTLHWGWFAGMFVACAAGLALFTRTVQRHS